MIPFRVKTLLEDIDIVFSTPSLNYLTIISNKIMYDLQIATHVS